MNAFQTHRGGLSREPEWPASSVCGTGVSPVQTRARRPCHKGQVFLRSHLVGLVLAVTLTGRAESIRADAATSDRPATTSAPFEHHEVAIDGGRIDWTNGMIVAEGIGKARGTGPQQRLMARRAAELVAARNAIATVQGIQIDGDHRVGGLRSGSVEVQGVIRGQQVTAAEWLPDAKPPHYRVRMEVPLWGVSGLGSLFWRTQQVQAQYGDGTRAALSTRPNEATAVTLVLDARGLQVTECLYPRIVDASGRVLYDLAMLPMATARELPPARYVESRLTIEQLRSEERLDPQIVRATQAGDDRRGAATVDPPNPSEHVRFDPNHSSRRILMKVKGVTDPHGTSLVLDPADVDRLAGSADVAAALRQARVLIIVDGPRPPT